MKSGEGEEKVQRRRAEASEVPGCPPACWVFSIKTRSGDGLPGGPWNFVIYILKALSV